jgi:hypothetical protein
MCFAAWIGIGSAEPRWVIGKYRNPALGYSLVLPHGLKGFTGDQAGPERGVRVRLPSGDVISVWGEPNSSGWKSPAEGIRQELSFEKCPHEPPEISPARVGSLKGAKGRLLCGRHVVMVLLAFRPGGGPIYWLRLDTTSGNEGRDDAALSDIAATFKLIPWQ